MSEVHSKISALFYFLSLSMIFLSCNGSGEADQLKQLYKENNSEIIGKQLQWDPGIFKVANPKYAMLTAIKGEKVLMIVGAECSPCIDKFIEWNKFLEKGKLKKTNVVFVAIGKNNGYFDLHVNQKNDFRFHILLDEESRFVPVNDLQVFQNMTFLLDQNNKVLLVGDPSKDQTILDYYNDEIEKIQQ